VYAENDITGKTSFDYFYTIRRAISDGPDMVAFKYRYTLISSVQQAFDTRHGFDM